MTKIDYENDRMQSVEQIDSAKRLSDKILELKDFEDEIANAEESLKKLKEKAVIGKRYAKLITFLGRIKHKNAPGLTRTPHPLHFCQAFIKKDLRGTGSNYWLP